MTTTPLLRPLLALATAAAICLSACAAATPSTAPPAASALPSPAQSLPLDGAASDPGAGGGGDGTAGNPGTGVGVVPVDPAPVDPNVGDATLVRPLPGRLNPRPVTPIALQASVDGRHVLVKITWYGGVEPCSVLDSVTIERSGTDISLSPIEGVSDPNAICIEIAVLKATIVDLGDLEPGTWRITAPGSEAPPVVLTIG
jgi:hypothetical protein